MRWKMPHSNSISTEDLSDGIVQGLAAVPHLNLEAWLVAKGKKFWIADKSFPAEEASRLFYESIRETDNKTLW